MTFSDNGRYAGYMILPLTATLLSLELLSGTGADLLENPWKQRLLDPVLLQATGRSLL